MYVILNLPIYKFDIDILWEYQTSIMVYGFISNSNSLIFLILKNIKDFDYFYFSIFKYNLVFSLLIEIFLANEKMKNLK